MCDDVFTLKCNFSFKVGNSVQKQQNAKLNYKDKTIIIIISNKVNTYTYRYRYKRGTQRHHRLTRKEFPAFPRHYHPPKETSAGNRKVFGVACQFPQP